MIVNVGTMRAKPGKEKELEAMLLAMIEKAAPEEGTLTYTLHRAKEDEGLFLFYEIYQDQEALKYHASRPHVGEFMSSVGAFVSESKMTFYDLLSSVNDYR